MKNATLQPHPAVLPSEACANPPPPGAAFPREGGETDPLPPVSEIAPIRRILIPVDLSPRSVTVAHYAAVLGNQLGAELTFVHALERGWPLHERQKDVRDEIMSIPVRGRTRSIIREGSPARVILDTSRAERSDLILMAARRLSPVARVFSRSLTARVLNAASCPVWTGLDHAASLTHQPIRRVLCALSLGPRSGGVLRWAAALARSLGAALTVVHANKTLEPMPAYPCDREWRTWVQQAAFAEMRTLQAEAGTQADVWMEHEHPLVAIPSVANRISADVVVIGRSPQRRQFGGLLTMSYHLARRAPCPVTAV